MSAWLETKAETTPLQRVNPESRETRLGLVAAGKVSTVDSLGRGASLQWHCLMFVFYVEKK